MKVVVIGGAGYVDSYTAVEFIEHGIRVIALDNLSNCGYKSFEYVSTITNTNISSYSVDIWNEDEMIRHVFQDHSEIDAVIHFAGLTAVGESALYPSSYYTTNVLAL